MSVTDARVVRVGRVVQRARAVVAFDKSGVCHARVIEHVAPLQTHECHGGRGVIGEEVGLQLEAADEGGDGVVGFEGRRAVGAPAAGELGGDAVDLGAVGCDVGDDGPGVAVLGHEGCRLVVSVHAGRFIPEEAVRGGFDAFGVVRPCGDGRVVDDACEANRLVEDEVEDRVRLDVVAAHAEAQPVS